MASEGLRSRTRGVVSAGVLRVLSLRAAWKRRPVRAAASRLCASGNDTTIQRNSISLHLPADASAPRLWLTCADHRAGSAASWSDIEQGR